MKLSRVLKWGAAAILFVLFGWFQFAYWTSTNDCGRPIPAGAAVMKAIRFCEYGPPDVLKVVEVEKPTPKENELLVKVHAASVNFVDAAVRGDLFVRLLFGLRKPGLTGFGRDFAGVVETVGGKVTQFKAGDEVFGAKSGAVAEYVCIREDRAASKPARVSFEQAAAVPWAGLTALQGLRTGKVQAGQKVLINGASGGVGTFALQIAKAFGTEVTAVVSTRNVEIAHTLGADRVLDYTKEDFTKGDERYDLIYDNVNNRSFSERRRVLKPRGICVLAGLGGVSSGGLVRRIAAIFVASFRSRFTEQKFERYGTTNDQADLKFLSELLAQGKVTPFIDKTYRFDQAAEALRYFEQGHARGKIVITVANPASTPYEANR